MFTNSRYTKEDANKKIYGQINNAICNAADKGAMYIYLDKYDELCRNIQNHPEKNKIFDELKKCDYKIHELVSGSIKISWE